MWILVINDIANLKKMLFSIYTLKTLFLMICNKILLRFLAMLLPCKMRRHYFYWKQKIYCFDDRTFWFLTKKKHIFHQKLIFFSCKFLAGQTWYLLNIDWWHYWNNYVSNEPIPKKIAINSKIDTNDPTSNGIPPTICNQISTENSLR